LNDKGQRQDPKRLAHLFLHPRITDTVTVVGRPPSVEIVLADVYNEALREAFYRDELIPDAKVITSTVMANALKGLERMIDRDFSELDIRRMFRTAITVRAGVWPRWEIRTWFAGVRWKLIVEPDPQRYVLILVTAYPVGI
jgi:hypothetical protein